jgi:hypothetical protein
MRNPEISVLNRSIHKLLYREHWYRVWCLQVLAVFQRAVITCASKKVNIQAMDTKVALPLLIPCSARIAFPNLESPPKLVILCTT